MFLPVTDVTSMPSSPAGVGVNKTVFFANDVQTKKALFVPGLEVSA